MHYEPNAKYRFYVVKTWTKGKVDAAYGQHWQYGVVATSVINAVELIREKHPEARIDNVNCQGIAHYWPR